MSLSQISRVVLPCRDLARQRDFYSRILGLRPASDHADGTHFDLENVTLVLRARGDALFPREGDPGMMLVLPVATVDFDRWHRRLLMNRVAVLDAPHPLPEGGQAFAVSDPEGNVVEICCD